MVTATRRTRSNKKSTRPASGRKAAARHRAAASKAASAKSKWVYRFGNGKAEGRADMRNLLGGKGAGLGEKAHPGQTRALAAEGGAHVRAAPRFALARARSEEHTSSRH